MQFNIKLQNDFKNNIRREWALTNGRGCYAQAWSVGEVLRCYCEDVLPMLPQAHS